MTDRPIKESGGVFVAVCCEHCVPEGGWWWWWWWWWRCGDDDANAFAGRTGSSVSKLRPEGKSHNWAASRTLCWLICQNKLVISAFTKIQQIAICVFFFLLLLLWHCVCLCIHVSLRKNMKPEAYICSLFGAWNRLWCCLASGRQNRCCSSLCRCPSGRLKKTKCLPRVQTVRSLSVYPFHYELWFDPLSWCLSCSFIRYKPPQPQQDSKGSHTVQQGSHEANKHDQIKARFFIPGIRREFFTTLLLFLLKYEWLCLPCAQIIYLCVSRPFVAPSGLKYSEGLSVCHVCYMSPVLFCRCLTLLFWTR